MERVTKPSNSEAKIDLRALVNGQYLGDANALIEAVAADLLAGVSARIEARTGAKASAVRNDATARKELASRLAQWLVRDDSTSGSAHRFRLPVSRWSPEEVIEKTGISKSTLYRGDPTQFFSVVPVGKKNGRVYPSWQFTGDIPAHLPAILDILHGSSKIQVNTFLMSEQDALNELSPAEVLAGMPFEDRQHVARAQTRVLALPFRARLAKVSALARMEVADSL
jgi:hypothetical protein